MTQSDDYALIVIWVAVAGVVCAATANGPGKLAAVVEKRRLGRNSADFTRIPIAADAAL
jgi:pyruvate/2-oxoglutarate dehydrogenase complex dihydrolipoamide dehydrogenase (E3) component